MLGNRVATGADWFEGMMDYGTFKSNGLRFAMRYIVPQIQGKMIQHAEIMAAHALGIDLGFIYETNGISWRGGGTEGLVDGAAARMALKSIAAPETCAAYLTIDSQAMPADVSTVLSYINAARKMLSPYRCGVYGEFAVVEAAYMHLPDVFRWQTMAWSQGQVSDHVDLLQMGSTTIANVELDIDAAYHPYFGQWFADQSRQPINQIRRDDVNGNIIPNAVTSIPVNPGTASKIMLFCDVGLLQGEPQGVRVAVHSASAGYSQITHEELSHDTPLTVVFTARDVDAVSLSRAPNDGNGIIGYNII